MFKVRNAKLEYLIYLRNMTDEEFADYMLKSFSDPLPHYQAKILQEASKRLKDEISRPMKVTLGGYNV